MNPDIVRRREEIWSEIPKEEIEKLKGVYNGLYEWWVRETKEIEIGHLRDKELMTSLDKAIVEVIKPHARSIQGILKKFMFITVGMFDPLFIKNWDEAQYYVQGTLVNRVMENEFLYDMYRFHEEGVKEITLSDFVTRADGKPTKPETKPSTIKRPYPFYGIEYLYSLDTEAKAKAFYHRICIERFLAR